MPTVPAIKKMIILPQALATFTKLLWTAMSLTEEAAPGTKTSIEDHLGQWFRLTDNK